MNKSDWLLIGGAGASALAIVSPMAIAADYMSIESAQREFFPGAGRYDEVALTLTAAQKQAIDALAGPQPPHGKLRVWRALLETHQQGYVFVDEVVGRQDFITYAIGIDAAGKLSAIEILTYRESHGGEIHNAAWRKQFTGRDSLAQVRFSIDIKNIAGATLSSRHVTQGARWILALWQTVLKAPGVDAR